MTASNAPDERLTMVQSREGLGWVMSLTQPCPRARCDGTVSGMATGTGPHRPKMAKAMGSCDRCHQAFGMHFEGDWSVECRNQTESDRPSA